MMAEPVAGRIFLSREEICPEYFFEDEPWHRIETAGTPGMAPGDAPCGHPAPSHRAMQPQGVDGIERTGRQMTASARQERRDEITIKINESEERSDQDFPKGFRGGDSWKY
jgi:hypothetical protein